MIVARHLGVPVKQHDDNSEPSMPDLRIEYRDREVGLVEVVRDIERHDLPHGVKGAPPNREQQRQRLSREGDKVVVPGFAHNWMAELTIWAMDIRAIKAALPDLLAEAERRGERYLAALPWSRLDPTAFRLFELGVSYVQAMNTATGDAVVSLIAPNSFHWAGGLDLVAEWCATMLARESDVVAKLAGAQCSERHAFLVPTTQGNLAVYRSLWRTDDPGYPGQLPALPTRAPALPKVVDRVWVRGPKRVIAWFPETGWVEVA